MVVVEKKELRKWLNYYFIISRTPWIISACIICSLLCSLIPWKWYTITAIIVAKNKGCMIVNAYFCHRVCLRLWSCHMIIPLFFAIIIDIIVHHNLCSLPLLLHIISSTDSEHHRTSDHYNRCSGKPFLCCVWLFSQRVRLCVSCYDSVGNCCSPAQCCSFLSQT